MTMPVQAKLVLVVEDDANIRDVLAVILADEGYAVTVAENGLEGLRRLRALPRPSVVLLDLMMPIMDGYEFRDLQRADAALASIPVIIFSASPDAAGIASLGAWAHLKKPLDVRTLLEAVAGV